MVEGGGVEDDYIGIGLSIDDGEVDIEVDKTFDVEVDDEVEIDDDV